MARRARGDGALFFEADRQRWVGRVVVDGKRRKVTGRTKTEARRRLAEIRAQADAGLPVAAGDTTVATLLDEWRKKAAPGRNVAPSTLGVYDWALDHLMDSLGRKRVRSLRPEDVESMLQRFADEGFSKSSLNKLRNTLGMALGWAERRGTAPRNVARIAEMPHGVRPAEEGRAMTGQQARAFAVACQESPFEALWLVSLYCGLRPGEAAALAWEDLDLEAAVVHVRRGLRRHPDGHLTVGPTKTAHSVRSLGLPEPVADAFRRRRAAQVSEQLSVGAAWSNPDGLVFTGSTGAPLQPKVRRHDFNRTAARAGIGDGWSPNDLRHTCTSLMSDAGIPLEVVADQLGHRDVTMASRHYRHKVRPTVGAGIVMAEVIGR